MLKVKKGRLLISEPSLTDDVFFKSVILLTHHSEEESIGLILNHPTTINLNEIFNEIHEEGFIIYFGGPVAKNSIQFIHTLGKKIPGAIEILNGLYWGGDFKIITQLISQKKISVDEIRFFAGYSGWESNQLNEEINSKSWIVSNTKKEDCIKYSTKDLWSQIIKIQKKEYAIWTNLPKNPNLN